MVFPDMASTVIVPVYMKEIIAEITSLARRSGDINQRSGVSVRVSIANYESMISNAYRRRIQHQEEKVVPRISDLAAIVPSTMGKIEMETLDDGREVRILEELTKKAVLNIFGRYIDADELEGIIEGFEEGMVVETGSDRPSSEYVSLLGEIEGFDEPIKRLGADNTHELIASAMEFILEGLHLKRRLNKDRVEGRYHYRT
jgi:magnesium chelatase subunit I